MIPFCHGVAQGPAWEAQCHADTHLLLAALKALPLDPKAADSTMDHLAMLCSLRFADPSPSGYTIPVPLPSPSAAAMPASSRTSPRRPTESPSSDQVSAAQTILSRDYLDSELPQLWMHRDGV